MATLAHLVVRFSADVAAFDAGLKGVEKSLGRTGRQFSTIGQSLTTAVTLPIVGLGVAALKMSTDFNSAMANVASLIPGNAARVGELKKAVQDMAVATGQSTADLAGGLYQVISAFGDTADTAAILEMNARAAAAGVASTADAINLTSAVTKGYGDTSAAAVQKVSDLALLAVRLGQTTFPELAASIGRVVPLAKQLKVSQEELFAVMATLTGVTGNAAAVSTQLRGVLQSLMAPTDTMSELFKKLGVKSGEALIQQRGLQGAIQTVVDAANSSGIPLQHLMSQIEGQTAALVLAGPQAKDYSGKLGEMQKAAGTAEAAFREQTGGINKAGFAMQQAKQQAAVLAQQMGDELAPAILQAVKAIQPLIGHVRDAVKWFKSLTDEQRESVIKWVAIAAAIGPLALVIGQVILAVKSLTAVLRILGAVAFSPAGLIIGGIVLLGLALVTLVTRWDDVTAAIRRNIEAQRGAAGGAFIAGTGGMRMPVEPQMSFATPEQLAAADIRQKALDPLAAIRFGQLDKAEQMWIDQMAPAKAAADTVAGAIGDLGAAGAKVITQFDILESQLKGLDTEWGIYSAQVGKAADSAVGLAAQKANLNAKLAVVRQQIGWLTAQYDQSAAKSGAFSEASLELAGQLDQAKLQSAQFSAAIRDANMAMVEFSPPVLAAKQHVKDLTAAVDSLTRTQGELGAQLETAKAKLAATDESIAALEKDMDKARGAVKSALGDMASHVDFLKTKIGDMRMGLKNALGDMAAYVSDLADQLSRAKGHLQDLTNVRLAGQGAFEDQIDALDQQERQLRLTMNGLKALGENAPKDTAEAVQKQLDQLSLVRERITLEREIQVEPLRQQIARLATETKELSFEEALNDAQKQAAAVKDLTTRYDKAKQTFDDLTRSVADVIDESHPFTLAFADAKTAAESAAYAIRATVPEYKSASAKLVEMQAAVAGVMGEARKLNFDAAIAAIEAHKAELEADAVKLAELTAKQEEQAAAVAYLTQWLAATGLALTAQKTALEQATAALDNLRTAAQNAAAGLSGVIGGATQGTTQTGTQPAGPSVGTATTTPAIAPTGGPTMTLVDAAALAVKQAKGGQIGAAIDTLTTQAGLSWEQAAQNILNQALGGVGTKPPLRFAEGGMVPGPAGSPVAAIVHGGERVLTPAQQGGTVVNVRVEGPIYGMLDFEQRVTQTIRDAIQGGAFRGVIPTR